MSIVLKALIDEDNCIGCSKCIRHCPTDAIVGAKHMLHTILPDLCTSCENCIHVCPTNCITLNTAGEEISASFEQFLTERRLNRLAKPTLVMKTSEDTIHATDATSRLNDKAERQQQVMDAIARVKMRKMLKTDK